VGRERPERTDAVLRRRTAIYHQDVVSSGKPRRDPPANLDPSGVVAPQRVPDP
jgi:hypothetical protein